MACVHSLAHCTPRLRRVVDSGSFGIVRLSRMLTSGLAKPSMPFSARSFRLLGWFSAVVVVIVSVLLFWGSNLLIAIDPTPTHADVAIVLQGSIVAEKTRLAGAIDLVQRGVGDRVLVDVPKESYWGQSIPPVARAYVERIYGSEAAARLEFCEMGPEVNSTVEEADAALGCVHEHGWRSIAVVTSDYHTRRAGILWRRTVKQRDPAIRVWVLAVSDAEFQLPWWRRRQSAKIWLLESSKLLWTILGG